MTRRSAFQLFAGLVVLAIGVFALLNQLDVISLDWDQIWPMIWPTVFTVAGVVSLIANPRSFVPALVVIAGGVLWGASNLGYVTVSFWSMAWPFALILLGIAILFSGLSRGRSLNRRRMNGFAFWWGGNHVSTAQDFAGGTMTAIMGGLEVDLRGANIQGTATISAFTFWGGVDIRVPPHWRVEATGVPIMGGWENKTFPPMDPNAPVLKVVTTAIMAGVSIRN